MKQLGLFFVVVAMLWSRPASASIYLNLDLTNTYCSQGGFGTAVIYGVWDELSPADGYHSTLTVTAGTPNCGYAGNDQGQPAINWGLVTHSWCSTWHQGYPRMVLGFNDQGQPLQNPYVFIILSN